MSTWADLDDDLHELVVRMAGKLGVSKETVLAIAILLLAAKMRIPEDS